MRTFGFLLSLVFLHSALIAQKSPSVLGNKTPSPPKRGPVVVHKVQYTGTLSEEKASFLAKLSLECTNKVETVLPLLTGDIAVTGSKLPEGLRLERSGKGYLLSVNKPGEYEVELNILAKITKADPWRKVEFTGPAATIGGVNAEVAGNGMELELLSGTPQPRANGEKSKISGALGADRKVSLRWQTKVTRQERPSLLTVQTISTVQVTPTIIKYSSVYNYDILQGKPTNVVLRLPASQALTSVKSSAPVRDRRIETLNGQQVLTIDFVKPLEKKYNLTLLTEQPRAVDQATAGLEPPEPKGVQRERGQVNLQAQDMKVEPGNLTGLRRVNAAADTIGAWQFFGREPFQLEVGMQRIEPVLNANDIVQVVLEEKMLKIIHALTLNVEKAGIYTVELTPQDGLMVADVVGTGISDWVEKDGKISLEFSARVMRQQQVTVVLEEMSDELPAQVKITPLLVTGALRQTAQIAVTPARGLELKKDDNGTNGLRETPTSIGLAFSAADPDWNLAINPRKLPPRLIAQVSNGVVIGENRVYGFAKIFYAISDQGVQQFHVRVPVEWENIQFLGTRKRRELKFADNNASKTRDYTLTLQDEVWDQYTLQVTYDLPLGEDLSLGGAHPMQEGEGGLEKLERDTGTIVIHSAANIKLEEPKTDLSRIDPSELDKHERGRITHPILYAYKYDGEPFDLKVAVGRYQEQALLNSVADYAELTTVVTGNGQVATTALLSVKKTDKDNPSFKLPEGSEFISCRINGTTVTPGLENDNYIIPLPEEASRNQVFEVQISYSEKHDKFKHDEVLAKMQTGRLKLSGPVTLNIPNTYSRWTVYVPNTHELYGFEGNMVAPRKKQYTLATAWERFINFLRRVNWAGPILTSLIMIGFLVILIVYLGKGLRRALITTGGIAGIMILGGVVIALSMGGMTSVKYAATDSEYRHPAESVTPGWHEKGEAEGERSYRSSISSRESRFRDMDEAGAEELQPNDPASKTESPSKKSPKPDANKESQPGNSTTEPTPAKPGQDDLSKGTPGGAGGIGGGGFGPVTGGNTSGSSRRTRVSGKEEDSGRVTGVLPPEFVIPTDGRAYVFTKALNLAGKDENERLKIDANIMDWNSHRTRTGIFHWLIALAGLLVLVREYRQKERDSRWITAGLALILGGVGAFTCSQGALHLLFINALWVLALAIYAWAAWYFWPAQRYSPPSPSSDDKGDGNSSDEPDQPAKGSDGTSAATATAILLLLFSLNTALAADPVLPPPRDAKAWEGLENLLRLLADPDVLLQKPGGPKVIREAQLQDRNGTWFEINQDNPFTGKVLGFFQNRQKRIESDYQDGLLHGVQTLWFDNGQKRQMTQHEKGLQHGVQTAWYRGGQKASESNYHKGKRQGSHSIWHPNGTLAGETSYLQGEPNGLARQWHNNGKIAREVRWERGRQLAFDTWTAKGVRFGEGTNTVSMVSASYQLNIHSEVAQVEAEFKLSARLTKQKFTLFREIIAVNEFSSVPAGAKLLREGPALVLYLPEAGEATVKMKFLTKHAGDATKRMLGFGIPSSLTSKVDVVLQEDDSEVEMPTAVTFSSSSGGNETLVEAVIGASDRLELTWKPRVKKAKEIAATVFVQNASTISFGNGVVQARTVLDYTVSQGELSEVKAVLPEGWKLMKVEGGKTMQTYFVNTEDDLRVLTAQLEKGVSTGYQLILEMEQTLAAPPTTVKLSMPRALGVKRETGFIALQSGEELGLAISESNGLLQVDGAEFTRNTKQKIQAGATSYGYNNPNYTLAAEVETILPEIEATARHLTAISEEKLLITTQVNYSIKHVGVFKFRLRLPAEAALRVKNVTGPSNPQWEEKTVDGSRLLLVTLKQHTKGTYPLRIELVQTVDALPEELRVVGVHPLDVDKLTNLVGIYAEEGVVVEELAEGKSDNLTEMSAARFGSVTAASNNSPQQMVAAPSIPANANALAYRHLDEAPGEEPGWNVTVSTKALEPWVRNAQLVNWIKLGNTRLTGHTRVRYEIERAPARQFTLILPATINTNLVKFEGANIRSRESRPTELGHLYTITLQDKVRPGQVYQLNIDWELSQWNVDKNGTLGFQGPVTQGTNLPESEQRRFTAAGMNPMVEGEEGWLVVSDESHTQLMISTGATLQGLEKKNTGDLPEWAKDGSESARLVYYYFRPGYQLDLNVKRLEDAAVEPAWISQANFNSVVTEDGQMMTRMWLEVNNHGKQFLGITLPGEKAEILSVFVNGQARRPTMQDKRFLVPLENSGELGAFPVEVTYTSRVDFPRMSGRVELPTPSFDVKLNNAHWWLYLPRDYAYSHFEGSMNRTDSQAIARRVSKLDTNKDGRLDQEEMGKDMQLGEILNNEDELTLDLAKANQNNPRSGAYYGYDFKSYKLQEMGNTKRVIDNIAKQQAIVESNFNKDNLSAINRYNDQSIKSINQLSGVLRGKSSEKYNQKLNALQDNQRKLESKRRDLQVEQEQYAQQRFAFRNAFNPQQWGGQNAGTPIVSSGQMSVSGRLDLLIADKETVERQKRQIDEIDRIQKRVTTGEVTPLNINLPRDGFFVAFSQPLQTEKDKPMTISFETENTRRTNWWGVLVWSTLAIAILFFMVQAIRHFALRKPPLAEA